MEYSAVIPGGGGEGWRVKGEKQNWTVLVESNQGLVNEDSLVEYTIFF